jgi:putative transposase
MGYWESYYHFIWATKNREPFLQDRVEALTTANIRDVSAQLGAIIRAVGLVDDHIHIAVSIPPRLSIPTFVRELKTQSNHAINNSRLLPPNVEFSWQREYGMFTFGRNSLEDIADYVKNQRHHHSVGTIRPYFEITDSREAHTP